MATLVTVATAQLNQWALDLHGNAARIRLAIAEAVKANASLLITPELSLTGYGCLDHFLEGDLVEHCWEILSELLLEAPKTMVMDVGMPVRHRGCIYNCRMVFKGSDLLLIRPKMALANDGNFREARYFTAWPPTKMRQTETYILPDVIQKTTGQVDVRFGDTTIQALDFTIGIETCEELFLPWPPHVGLGFSGADIIVNSSGSHWELRRLDRRLSLILEATRKSPGVYLYSNVIGGDGDRIYYDGCSLIAQNGQVLALADQFNLKEVEVKVAVVDLEASRGARYPPSLRNQSTHFPPYNDPVRIQERLGHPSNSKGITLSPTIDPVILAPEKEISMGPAVWLWDYLRRSKQAGFFLPLSGGIDSCSTATIVYQMCILVYNAIKDGDSGVLSDLCEIVGEEDFMPTSPQTICGRIFHTAYMGTTNSSAETRERAKGLAKDIGSYHLDFDITPVVTAVSGLWTSIFGLTLRYKTEGGTVTQGLALQNIQARLRMTVGYLLAATIPMVRKRQKPGGLLVLAASNVDECLRGYLTKYDASSGDLNPIGAVSKHDLKLYISWAEKELKLPILRSFLEAVPTAELEPISATYTQSDEADMGTTYENLSLFGRLRKMDRMGPFAMWTRLTLTMSDRWSPREMYEKVRHFFFYYGINRHKMTTITPAVHCNNYSVDDNRYDMRPFLYPSNLYGYKAIEDKLAQMESTNHA